MTHSPLCLQGQEALRQIDRLAKVYPQSTWPEIAERSRSLMRQQHARWCAEIDKPILTR